MDLEEGGGKLLHHKALKITNQDETVNTAKGGKRHGGQKPYCVCYGLRVKAKRGSSAVEVG